MKHLLSLWFLLGWLGLASCATNPPQPTLAPTSAVAQLPDTPNPAPTATSTLVPPSPTGIPLTSTATLTPEPTITSTPTPSPSPTPTVALPLPQGRLFFFWDPRSHTSAEEPAPNLYQVVPNPQTNQWDIQIILYHLNVGSHQTLSPDQQWLTMFISGDITPSFTPRNYPPDTGDPIIYTFNLQDFSYRSWVDDFWGPVEFVWIDNETIAYRNSLGLGLTGLFTVSFTNPDPQPLGDWITNEEPAAFSLSPNGRFWAVGGFRTQNLIFHDNSTNQTTIIPNVPLLHDIYDMAWNASSEWLAAGPNLLVANPQTLELVPLTGGYLPYWSADGQWLAFLSKRSNAENQPSSLKVWHVQDKQEQVVLENFSRVFDPLWHPNHPTLTIGLKQEGISSLSLINVPERVVTSLYELHENTMFIPCAWSPDGEWLVFYMQNGELTHSGIYLIHQSGQGLHPLVESDDRIMAPDGATSPPAGCFWLLESTIN